MPAACLACNKMLLSRDTATRKRASCSVECVMCLYCSVSADVPRERAVMLSIGRHCVWVSAGTVCVGVWMSAGMCMWVFASTVCGCLPALCVWVSAGTVCVGVWVSAGTVCECLPAPGLLASKSHL
eukprot:170957-Chlamydomonas_euryale.AAC.7